MEPYRKLTRSEPADSDHFDRWFAAVTSLAQQRGLNLNLLPSYHWNDIRRLYRTQTPPLLAVSDLELL